MTGTIITKKGIALITKLLASKQQLVFTRAAVGTGTVPAGYDPAGMVGLNQYKMDAEISGYSAEGEEATVIFQISSANVEEGFIITEAGLFAEDADDGEILYAYLSLTDDPQYVYAKNNVIQKFAEIEFRTVIGEVESMTVIMSPGALVTKEEFEIAEKKIEGIENPEFDDYSSEDVEIPDTREAIANIKSKKGIFGILSNVKAALMGLVTLGEMRGLLVNNGLCSEAGKFFLDAAFGKNLQDQLTKLNSDFARHWKRLWEGACSDGSITITDLSKYNMFAVGAPSVPVILIGWRIYNTFHAYGIDMNAYTLGHRIYCMQAGISNDQLTNIKTAYMTVSYEGTNSGRTTFEFTDIWGIF